MSEENYGKVQWQVVIEPRGKWVDLDLAGTWRYRDLILMFFKRDFIAFYKQSILGPLWYLIQPALTSLTYFVIFSRVANLSTDGLPPFLFYMCGIVLWTYFSSSLINNAETFSKNAQLFSKVYFPRLVVPVSVVLSGMVALGIQFALLLVVTIGLLIAGTPMQVNWLATLAMPALVAYVACLGMGVGLLISALTVRFRDLAYATGFVTQLWMFISPVVYPFSQIPETYRILYHFNPMTAPIESLRAWLFSTGGVPLSVWLANLAITVIFLLAGLVLFSRAQSTAMDTV